MMVASVEEATQTLYRRIGVTCLHIEDADASGFILSDHPVSHYDPKPKFKDAAAGFLSSDASATWVPLDPAFGILLVQQCPVSGWSGLSASRRSRSSTCKRSRGLVKRSTAIAKDSLITSAATRRTTLSSPTSFATGPLASGSHDPTARPASTRSNPGSEIRSFGVRRWSPSRAPPTLAITRGHPSANRRADAAAGGAEARPTHSHTAAEACRTCRPSHACARTRTTRTHGACTPELNRICRPAPTRPRREARAHRAIRSERPVRRDRRSAH